MPNHHHAQGNCQRAARRGGSKEFKRAHHLFLPLRISAVLTTVLRQGVLGMVLCEKLLLLVVPPEEKQTSAAPSRAG
jgi:hypothetical protein